MSYLFSYHRPPLSSQHYQANNYKRVGIVDLYRDATGYYWGGCEFGLRLTSLY